MTMHIFISYILLHSSLMSFFYSNTWLNSLIYCYIAHHNSSVLTSVWKLNDGSELGDFWGLLFSDCVIIIFPYYKSQGTRSHMNTIILSKSELSWNTQSRCIIIQFSKGSRKSAYVQSLVWNLTMLYFCRYESLTGMSSCLYKQGYRQSWSLFFFKSCCWPLYPFSMLISSNGTKQFT